ncbi:hypothetical protein NDU88_010703 [Pleurodeles waltl]|uniref:Uncharacterized protein n=1 Tax=Pleurodeles waltl TaxID=8319 RepID=A0AAV7QV60_PLEWA|nr:hypothetical protein NDU88_010703 [Pleurodeles waltl]
MARELCDCSNVSLSTTVRVSQHTDVKNPPQRGPISWLSAPDPVRHERGRHLEYPKAMLPQVPGAHQPSSCLQGLQQ